MNVLQSSASRDSRQYYNSEAETGCTFADTASPVKSQKSTCCVSPVAPAFRGNGGKGAGAERAERSKVMWGQRCEEEA